MKRTGWVLCVALIAALLLAGCAGKKTNIEPQGKAYFTYFYTVSYVYSYAGDSAERFEAVSYTHLDVYKRQLLCRGHRPGNRGAGVYGDKERL